MWFTVPLNKSTKYWLISIKSKMVYISLFITMMRMFWSFSNHSILSILSNYLVKVKAELWIFFKVIVSFLFKFDSFFFFLSWLFLFGMCTCLSLRWECYFDYLPFSPEVNFGSELTNEAICVFLHRIKLLNSGILVKFSINVEKYTQNSVLFLG